MFGKSRQPPPVERPVQRDKTRSWNFGLLAVLMAAGAIIGAYAAPNADSSLPSPKRLGVFVPNVLNPNCRIKGNISINTGEKIYHVPGQKYYIATRIRSEFGERWFCTEAEARSAGWRKAGF